MEKSYYREFTCVECGAKGIDRGPRQNAKYCSPKCNNRHRKRKLRAVEQFECKHNEGVICNNQKCDSCGWNPEVQKVREEKIYGKE
jgi:hypothetical protein